jgi:hypothetical protein
VVAHSRNQPLWGFIIPLQIRRRDCGQVSKATNEASEMVLSAALTNTKRHRLHRDPETTVRPDA